MTSSVSRAVDRLSARLLSTVGTRLIRTPPISLTSRQLAPPESVLVPTRHGNVRCFITRASTATAQPGTTRPPVHIHLHGGAFLVGAPHQDDHLVRGIAGEVGATVVNVDYSAGAGIRFPQAHEESYDVLRWVREAGDTMGWDSDRVSISGVSAGGNLALGALELARRHGNPAVRAAVLIVPFVDATIPPARFTSPLPPSDGKAQPPFVSPRLVRLTQATYFADAPRRADVLASPALGAHEIAALPPLLVVTAEQDSVRVQDERFVDRARSAGVPVTAVCIPGVDHGFPQSTAARDEPAIRQLADLIRVHLAQHLS